MELKFSDEQRMLRETTRDLCQAHCGPDVVRRLENDPQGVPAELWRNMREMGLPGILVPQELGGLGLNLLDCAVIFEELGRVLAPGPLFASAVLSVLALRRAGGQDELLRALGAGEQIVVPAWLEPDSGYRPAGVQLRAQPAAGGWRLDGVKRHVVCAAAADALLVLARTGSAAEDIDLFLVDRAAPGVVLEQQRTMATDTQYRVALTGVLVPESRRLGAPQGGWRIWHGTMLEAIILAAATAAGGAERALEITVQYSKDRQQFGKPIGAFQALAHYMADAAPVVEGAKMLVYEAAWAHATGREIARLAPMAKLFACKAFRDVTAMAEQVHGGIGFTLDYDIQLFYRRAKHLQLNWWDSRYLEELVAAHVLDRPGERTIPDPFTG